MIFEGIFFILTKNSVSSVPSVGNISNAKFYYKHKDFKVAKRESTLLIR
ncbi:hypothetical protein SAMN05421594_1348 [Chryseobacterium oleae]|uniref:Uncharacterized protein n=1 Tax=Chryseobacterium oleae TaxID=491207 RepID=A0A1I4WM20_CHROL|nr:hypothetical protein SAMN05421594_1348 [Chryseobacterium oleae]